MKCDFCGRKLRDEDLLITTDEHGSLVYICKDCVLKMFRKNGSMR